MEDESDVEFEGSDDVGAMSDVQFSSSDDEDETKPAEAGADDPELEGERELEKAEREAKKAARKKQQDNFLKPKVPTKRKASVALGEESKAEDAAGGDEGADQDSAGYEMINGRPRKKSERISWVPQDGPVRQSSRSLAVANKERTIQRLEESEKRRLQIIAQMEAAKQRQGGSKKKKVMTQAERLEEAKITERRNLRSLNRWEEAENQRAEARRERLAALHGQRITGPVVRFWSGKGEWNGEGTLVKMGKISLEERAKQREEEKKKARGGRRKTAKEKEEEAKALEAAASKENGETQTEADPKPMAEGDVIVVAKASSTPPAGTEVAADPTVTQPAAEVESKDKDTESSPKDSEEIKKDMDTSEKVGEATPMDMDPKPEDSKPITTGSEPVHRDSEPTKMDADTVANGPESTPTVYTEPVSKDDESNKKDLDSADKSTDKDVTMEDAPPPPPQQQDAPASPKAPVAPTITRITPPPPRPLIQVIDDDDTIELKTEPIESDIPSIKAPTVDRSAVNSEPVQQIVVSPEPEKTKDIPKLEEEEAKETSKTEEEPKETPITEGTQEPEGTPKPTPPPQAPQYGVRNVVILEDFDPPMTWESTNRFLFPNNIAAVRRDSKFLFHLFY